MKDSVPKWLIGVIVLFAANWTLTKSTAARSRLNTTGLATRSILFLDMRENWYEGE